MMDGCRIACCGRRVTGGDMPARVMVYRDACLGAVLVAAAFDAPTAINDVLVFESRLFALALFKAIMWLAAVVGIAARCVCSRATRARPDTDARITVALWAAFTCPAVAYFCVPIVVPLELEDADLLDAMNDALRVGSYVVAVCEGIGIGAAMVPAAMRQLAMPDAPHMYKFAIAARMGSVMWEYLILQAWAVFDKLTPVYAVVWVATKGALVVLDSRASTRYSCCIYGILYVIRVCTAMVMFASGLDTFGEPFSDAAEWLLARYMNAMLSLLFTTYVIQKMTCLVLLAELASAKRETELLHDEDLELAPVVATA